MDESPRTLTPDQRRELEQLSALRTPAQRGVRNLVLSIHRDPFVRDRIPLESVCSVPIPHTESDGWVLTSLIFVPLYEGDRIVGASSPHSAILWRWPSREVARLIELKEDLKSRADTAGGESTLSFSHVYALPVERLRLENEFYHNLEQALSAPPDAANLQALKQLYDKLLPRGFYNYFRELVPASEEWLNPEPAQAAAAGEGSEARIETDEQKPQAPASSPATGGAVLETVKEEARAPHRDLEAHTSLMDLTDAVNRWLEEAQTLARDFSLKDVSANLESLERFQLSAGAQVAFVGETKNGKSRLINLLLGRDVLLETPLPAACWSAQIRHSQRETFEIETAPNVSKQHPPGDDARWNLLLRDDVQGQGGVVRVRISLNDAWLKDLGAVLNEPAGINRDEACDRVAREAAGEADALVFVLSAPHLLTRNEKEFLADEYARRRLSRMVVVVTKLDEIDAVQRSEVLNRIQSHVATISPNIRVVSLQPGAAGRPTDESVAEVKRQIERLIPFQERAALRSYRVAWGVLAQFRAIAKQGQAAVEEQERESEKRRAEFGRALEALEAERSQWLELLEHWEKLRLSRVEGLRELIRAEERELLEVLQESVLRESSPRAWWERRMPLLIKQHRGLVSKKYGPGAARVLEEDYGQLRQVAAQRFGLTLSARRPEPLAVQPLQPRANQDAPEAEHTDEEAGLFSRFVQLSLGPKYSWYRKELAGIWTTLTDSPETQRRNLRPAMEELVSSTVSYYATHLASELSKAYDNYSADAQREWDAHEERKREALESEYGEKPDDSWARLLAEATARAAEIQEALD